ncbi:MAG TPA: arabinofuranosidase catalytic domain-containing protein [Rugosimonospora sp.]|nr:arabinofuranosidase catalytic domain-containing protein [Rugosimonospora sp.]
MPHTGISRGRSALVAAAGALVLGGAGLTGTHAASAATAGCQVTYAVTSQWPGGFGASVTVTNLGDAVNGWRLSWSFAAGQAITQLWNGSYTQSGAQVMVTNASWNGAVATGASASVGFNASAAGGNPVPASFALNDTTCTGAVSAPPSTPAPSPAGSRPCDLYATGGTPCVAAHSTTRALYAAYSGSLYQVRRASDSTTRNIGLGAGGYADAAAQDSFCANTTCVITVVFDQSGRGNDLWYQGSGSPVGGQDVPASATSESVTAGGGKVYSLFINQRNSYWRDGHLTGVPTGSAPQGVYMVTSGTHVNSGCCFDYGNSETDRKADGAGAMDAISFSTSCWFGGCTGTGPWVQADLEFGLFPGGSTTWNPNQRAFTNRFVTAMTKNNGTTRFAIKGANAQSGGLTTMWDGALPGGYNPMRKQGAIVLGSGGDCCATNTNLSIGTFYEGAVVSGFPSDATDNAVQANIAAAGYR